MLKKSLLHYAKPRAFGAAVVFAAAIGLALIGGASRAQAVPILDNSGVGTTNKFAFGAAVTTTYGQTFTAAGPENRLDGFSMFLRERRTGSGTLDLRGYVAEWSDGFTLATSILFESATQTMNAAGTLQEFAFSTGGLDLTIGNKYVLFISIANLPAQAESRFGMPLNNGSIAGGNFVFTPNTATFANLTTAAWRSRPAEDAWIKAQFSTPVAVPEPATIALFGLGVLGLGVARRRKKQAV